MVLENAADADVKYMDNRIEVYDCKFYETVENGGFVIRTFGHIMGLNWSLYEIAYAKSGYRLLYLSNGVLEDDISDGICDGEFLYYMHSDGNLRRIDKNGEIKTYPVFENGNDFVRDIIIEAEGDEITITSPANYWVKEASTVVVNVQN